MHISAVLSIFGVVGFIAITITYSLIQRFSSEWRWVWGLVVVFIYYVSRELIARYSSNDIGPYGIFVFTAGAVLASALICVFKKPENEN
jgi:hypothetical protein